MTLLAFSSRGMLLLRVAALGANVFFIAYGAAAELWPVLCLHLLLVPVNTYRLAQLLAQRRQQRRAWHGPSVEGAP